MKSEAIQAITPLFLGGIGLTLGLAVVFSPQISDAKWAAGFGLAGTAIAGASGLAQNRNAESANIQGSSVSIQNKTEN
ncbi:MAG: hypothetical protein V7L23_30035 [Nostoc sp.]|uniref:hypothetical protein n=1 Tax=Nostoc sp. TaxID=1180 RepID=UPI002FF0E124